MIKLSRIMELMKGPARISSAMSDSKSHFSPELMELPVKSSGARVPVLSLPEDSTAWALSKKT
jgi:hypothetical protein